RPGAFGFMLEFDIFLSQFDDGVLALVHVQVEPVAFNAALADADAGGKPATMIAPRAISRNQGRHQAIRQAALGVLIGLGHGDDALAAGEGITLARIKAPAHAAPVIAAFARLDRMPQYGPAVHVNQSKLATIATRIVPQ